jgi:hypothetical protein
MGAYINPENMTKEEWLANNGQLIAYPPEKFDEMPGKLAVCLVDNGAFTAAGIAFDERELQAFTHPDGRPKKWYWVDKEKLMDPNISDLHYYLKDAK